MRWRRTDETGTDHATLSANSGGWLLAGEAHFTHEGLPWRLRYAVEASPAFETMRATIEGRTGGKDVRLEIVNRGGQWLLNGVEAPGAAGCVDLDLAFTPATNLLPLRRLRLPVGDEREAPAAWLRVPQLDLARLPQTYRRLGPDTYAYASGDFTATLRVDADGFVTDYGGLWTVTPSQGTPVR